MLTYRVGHTVDGPTVTFRIEADGEDPILARDHFSFTFDREIGSASASALYNAFFALFLSALPQDLDVVIEVPREVDARIPWLWTRYHRLPRARVQHRGAGQSISLQTFDQAYREREHPPLADNAIARGRLIVLFGGGKDSSATLDLFARTLGPENVLPMTMTHQKSKVFRREKRRVDLSLGPASESLGVPYTCLRTNFWVSLRGTGNFTGGLATYHAAALIAAEVYGCRGMCYSLEYTHYFTRWGYVDTGGCPHQELSYRQTRPETNRLISEVFSHVLGDPFIVFNANRFVSERMPLVYLSKSQSPLLKSVMMCENSLRVSERFCMRCKKCFEFSLQAMVNDLPADGFDFDRFYTESPFVEKALALLSGIGSPEKFIWDRHFGVDFHVAGTRDMLHAIGPKPGRIQSDAARDAFRRIQEYIGRQSYPAIRQLWRDGIDEEDYPAREKIWSRVTRYADPVTGPLALPWGVRDGIIESGVTADVLDMTS